VIAAGEPASFGSLLNTNAPAESRQRITSPSTQLADSFVIDALGSINGHAHV